MASFNPDTSPKHRNRCVGRTLTVERGVLERAGFDKFVEGRCARFYDVRLGRPSLRPGIHFRSLLIGYFEGIDGERGIAWRMADSLALRRFLGIGLDERTKDDPVGKRGPKSTRLNRVPHRQMGPSGLTIREREVLQLLADGLCSREVAGALRLSLRAVENHRARMMRRLEMHSFAELIRHGIRHGVIPV